MRLYHFCCERDARKILKQGITEGAIALPQDGQRGYYIRTGWQWVTLELDRAKQSWATKHLIRYDRTTCRLTLEIPDPDARSRLYDRATMTALYPETEQLFDGWEGSEQWRVFRGNIPKRWIAMAERWDAARGEWELMERR